MSAQDSRALSPAARSTALVVARILFLGGLMFGMGLTAVAVAVLFYHVGGLVEPMERWLVGAVMIGLAVMAFGFSAMGKSRITKLKEAS